MILLGQSERDRVLAATTLQDAAVGNLCECVTHHC